MQDARYLELHTPLFHAGKNFKTKLTPGKGDMVGLKAQWDEKRNWFEIKYNGRRGYIFSNNVAFWEADEGDEIELPKNEHATESVIGRKRAQVSTPTGHVFEGEGHGKSR